MIYRALEVIQIFLAGGQASGRTKVFQEVLADLKIVTNFQRKKSIDLNQSRHQKKIFSRQILYVNPLNDAAEQGQ